MNEVYNNFSNARRLPTMIINYLKRNAPNVWRILKYFDAPYQRPELTTEEINKLIVPVWSSTAADEYAVLPLRYSGQAITKQDIQLRISMYEDNSVNRTTTRVRVMLQFICNNNASLISSPYSNTEDRAFALMQEAIAVLNGAELPEIATVLNMDGAADNAVGWYAAKFSDTYSGYECIMSCMTQ